MANNVNNNHNDYDCVIVPTHLQNQVEVTKEADYAYSSSLIRTTDVIEQYDRTEVHPQPIREESENDEEAPYDYVDHSTVIWADPRKSVSNRLSRPYDPTVVRGSETESNNVNCYSVISKDKPYEQTIIRTSDPVTQPVIPQTLVHNRSQGTVDVLNRNSQTSPRASGGYIKPLIPPREGGRQGSQGASVASTHTPLQTTQSESLPILQPRKPSVPQLPPLLTNDTDAKNSKGNSKGDYDKLNKSLSGHDRRKMLEKSKESLIEKLVEKKWLSRYIRLQPTYRCLIYYLDQKSRRDDKIRGIYNLLGAEVNNGISGEGYYCFNIRLITGQTLDFRVESQVLRDDWCDRFLAVASRESEPILSKVTGNLLEPSILSSGKKRRAVLDPQYKTLALYSTSKNKESLKEEYVIGGGRVFPEKSDGNVYEFTLKTRAGKKVRLRTTTIQEWSKWCEALYFFVKHWVTS